MAALYAAAVYLALAQRTRLATYAYLGWAASVVAALALVPWLNASLAWWSAALGGVALLLLGARRVARLPIAASLGPAATQMAAVAAVGALAATETLARATFGVYDATGFGGALPGDARAAFAVGAWMLVALGAAWSATLRGWAGRARALVTPADLAVAVFAAQAALATAVWAHASSRAIVALLSLLAALSLGAALALRWWRPAWSDRRRGLEGLALLLALLGMAALAPLGFVPPTWTALMPLSVAALVVLGIALAEDARWWLLVAGLFLTLDYLALIALLRVPYIPQANLPTVVAALPLALWAVAQGLYPFARARRFALPLFVVALADALLAASLLPYNPDPVYQSALLLAFALAAYLAARRLGEALAGAALVALFGALSAVPLVAGTASGLRPSALALGLALVALTVRRTQGRVWAYGPYLAAGGATLAATLYTSTPGVNTAVWSLFGVSYTAWLLLAVATLAAVASWWEAVPWGMAAPAALAAWGVTLAGSYQAAIALVFVLAGAGMAARRWRGPGWGAAWYAAAVYGTLVAVKTLFFATPDLSGILAAALLAFALLAYLVAALEGEALFTGAAVVYAVAAAVALPEPAAFAKTLALTAALGALGVVVSRLAGRRWAWALYAAAIGASLFAILRVSPHTPASVEALCLIFAAAAYGVTVLERAPGGAVVSALYAAAAALAQPDAHALLPLALGLALAGLVAGRVAGLRWSYPFYAAAAFTAILTTTLDASSPHFEAVALLALALAAYAVAAVESRPDVLPLALLLGVLALASGGNALALAPAQVIVAFAGLAWVYALAAPLWRALPWLRPGWDAAWAGAMGGVAPTDAWRDPRVAGARIHGWASVLIGTGAVVVGIAQPGSFTPHADPTQAVALALGSLAVLLAVLGRASGMRLLLYLAGELVALAISWAARWLGATDVQAFIVAPGSYLLVAGAILPGDARVRGHRWLGQGASLAGALLLTLPTLAQSFTADHAWVYALILALEALVIVGAGVGTHARPLVVAGSAFVGLAALRGAVLAIQSGLPIPVVIGALAVLLLGGATWLSLRARRAGERAA